MDLLVCVGGGGQHIALAVARMVRLGVWTNVPKVLVIDADLGSPLARRLKAFADPKDQKDDDQKSAAPSVPHPFKDMNMTPPLAAGAAGSSFRSAFLGTQGGGGDNPGGPIEEELYELFYSEDADTVNIKEGMAARPAVGAAVFADLGIRHLRETLEGSFKQVQRVLVASSFIGGTGAGVTHQLVKFLHESPYRKDMRMHGAFLLQWLQLPTGGVGAANDLTMTNSADHGIQHFVRETAPRLTNAMLVGSNKLAGPTKANDSQDETVSIFPLLAAFGLTRMLSDTAGARTGSDDGDNIFTLTTQGPQWHWLLSERWNSGGTATPSIAERWAATRVVEAVVRLFESVEGGVEFRQLATHDAFRKTGIAGLLERENWGTAIRSWAKSKGREDVGLAAEVLNQLIGRMKQMSMVTEYLHEVFGPAAESVLGKVGSNELQTRYAGRQKMTKPQAYGYLHAALRHRPEVLKLEGSGDPAAYIARLMEEALMEEVVKGPVIG